MDYEGKGSPRCATVKIKSEASEENPAGFVVINESDFDKTKHEPFVESDAPAAEAKPSKKGRRDE